MNCFRLFSGKTSSSTCQNRNFRLEDSARTRTARVTFSVIVVLCTMHLVSASPSCIKSKVGTTCASDDDCFEFNELHLYCNKTHAANVCSFQVHTYASQSEADRDCPGAEFSAEPWSNPVSDDWMTDVQGVDCMRLCYLTETCFGISIAQSKCYLKNEKCFPQLQDVQGALFGVLSVTREDYHCGCHYPFTRRSSDGEILSWDSDCPESQLDRNPYRCCSPKGLCVKCETHSSRKENKTNFW